MINFFDAKEVANSVNKDGAHIIRNFVQNITLDNILSDVSLNRISLAENKVGGVYLKNGQYFHSQLLAISREFVNFALSKSIHDLCKTYFNGAKYRLKCHRYYENFGWYKGQAWHIDNKNGSDEIIENNKGLIFITYFDETIDGAFEYLRNSHGRSSTFPFSWGLERVITTDYINENAVKATGSRGDLIVYDTSLIHRAGKINKKETVRKALFMQIDTDMSNGEPMFVMPGLIPNQLPHLSSEEIAFFLGFGLEFLPKPWPMSNHEQFVEFNKKLAEITN